MNTERRTSFKANGRPGDTHSPATAVLSAGSCPYLFPLTLLTPSSANRRVGIPLVLLAGIFWSTSGILYRLIQESTPWQVLLYRSLALLAALSLWLGWRYRGQVRGTLGKAGLPALAGGLCLGTAFSGYILALEYTTVANAMFLLASAPFFAALAGWIILGERIALYMWVAMAVAAVGIGMMAGEVL